MTLLPVIVDATNKLLRQADCSVNDVNFGKEISKNPPPAPYPSSDEWKAAADIEPPPPVGIKEIFQPPPIETDKTNVPVKINRGLDTRIDIAKAGAQCAYLTHYDVSSSWPVELDVQMASGDPFEEVDIR